MALRPRLDAHPCRLHPRRQPRPPQPRPAGGEALPPTPRPARNTPQTTPPTTKASNNLTPLTQPTTMDILDDILRFLATLAAIALLSWLAALAIVHCLDAEADQIRQGTKDPRTATLPVIP